MIKTKRLLKQLTKRLPPGDGKRHNFTIDDKGNLNLHLMMDELYYPVIFSGDDMNKSTAELVYEIQELYKNRRS